MWPDCDWSTPGNWSLAGVPDQESETAVFDTNLADDSVEVTEPTEVGYMEVKGSAVVDLTLDTSEEIDLQIGTIIGGGTRLYMGQTATLNLIAGHLYVGGPTVLVDRATLNIYGVETYWENSFLEDVIVAGDVGTNTAGIGLTLGAKADTGSLRIASGRVVVDGHVPPPYFYESSEWRAESLTVGPDIPGSSAFGQLTLRDGGRMRLRSAGIYANAVVRGFAEAAGQNTITVQTGGELDVGYELRIGPYGRLELFDSASRITTPYFSKTDSSGSFNWTGGTLEITDSHLFLDSSTPDSVFGSNLTVGAGKRLVVSQPDPNDSLFVGNTGTGSLTIENGGVVETYRGVVGWGGGSNGNALVRGAGSSLTTTEGLRVGSHSNAVGQLTVENQGVVHAAGWINIGMFHQAHGTVVVQTSGSLTSDSQVHVGGYGDAPDTEGTLNIASGGNVSAASLFKVWDTGTVRLMDGGSQLTADEIALSPGASFSDSGGTLVRANRLTGFGNHVEFTGNLQLGHAGGVSPAGSYAVNNGQSLTVGQSFVVGLDAPGMLEIHAAGAVSSHRSFIAAEEGSGGSVVTIDGNNATWTVQDSLFVGGDPIAPRDTGTLIVEDFGGVEVANTLKVWNTGTVVLQEAFVSADAIDLAGGTLQGSGHLSLDGPLSNAGVVAPTNLQLIRTRSSYIQDASGKLVIELAGTDWEDFGHLIVAGAATLGGTLDVSLAPGYVPSSGDSFAVVESSTGALGGGFMTMNLPVLGGGLGWNVSQDSLWFTLQVVEQGLPGDYNGNGMVDAADYTVWRDTLGQTGEGLAADGTGPLGVPDGTVDSLDYDFWKSHFGSTLGGDLNNSIAASTDASIPEPAVWWLIGVILALLVTKRSLRKEA